MTTRPGETPAWLTKEAATSLRRLMPRLESHFQEYIKSPDWEGYRTRLEHHFPRFFSCFHALYQEEYDFFYYLENVLRSATQMWTDRPDELKALDAMRETDPEWYLSHRMVGAMCYVDLFAGDFEHFEKKIAYLKELGITYLHLMPVFKVPEGDNDGGYAVSSYRETDPKLGTMEQLAKLASRLRQHGISLVLDFVFNHTSNEHEWAQLARAGNEEYQEYYKVYSNREVPDDFERSLKEVFPEDHPGAFTYSNRMKKWVWTTFNNYQWDLNYENPEVFNRMLEEMLFLANQGVEILRFDAVAFIWKQLGTVCQNLPEAHLILQAFNALAKIAAPAMVFKSEAIVHPDEVRKYISLDECPLSYNPQLMALLWEALATRDVRVLNQALQHRFQIPKGCAWVNYLRCHDDIGWAFADDDVEAVGFNPDAHRRFLTQFYTGRYDNSFARGAPFMENPATGDARVSGTLASLCGLEKALSEKNDRETDLAIRRILLLHGIIITIGGIPLLYLGDEIAMLNDYTYDRDPEKVGDSRWLHRPSFDWKRAELRRDESTPVGRVYQQLERLIQLRQQNLAFTRSETELIDTGNHHVFGFFRNHEQRSVLVLANFTEREQELEARWLRQMGMRKTMIDLYAGQTIIATKELVLEPYQLEVLSRTM
jgi:amylosucrase/maltose alpha-D-glucosyltransferase/alpha-amylase